MAVLEDTTTRRARQRGLAGVIGTAFGVGVAVGAIVPLLSLLLEQRGYDAAEIGINAAMAPIGSGCFSLLVPRILSRLGLLKGIVLSITVTAALLLLSRGRQLFRLVHHPFATGCIGVVHWIASETCSTCSHARRAAAGSWASMRRSWPWASPPDRCC